MDGDIVAKIVPVLLNLPAVWIFATFVSMTVAFQLPQIIRETFAGIRSLRAIRRSKTNSGK